MAYYSKINFCGMDSEIDLGLTVKEIKRPILPELSEQKRTIEGMRGELNEGTLIGAKIFAVDFLLEANSETQAVSKMREIASFLKQTLDGNEYPLIFNDEPDVTYYAHIIDISEATPIAQNANDRTFTITFKCSEGVGIGELNELQLTEPTNVIKSVGNDYTYPIFTCVAKKDLTKIGLACNDGEYVYLGKGFDVENQDTPINQVPRILNDACNTLASWTKVTAENLTFNIENGVISADAEMRTTGNALRVTQKDGYDYFGAAVQKKWHGPARMQWLSKSCEDYKIETRFYLYKGYARARNKIELYLLDNAGKRIGRIMLKDSDESYEVLASAQIGYDTQGLSKTVYISSNDSLVKRTKNGSNKPKTISYKEKYTKVTGKGKNQKKTTAYKPKTMKLPQDLDENTFTGFYGVCTFTKKGNVYTAEFQKCLSNGKPTGKKYKGEWTDKNGTFANNKIAGICVYLAKYDITEDSKAIKYKANPVSLTDIKVYEILGETEQIVARAGDEITINCEENTIYKNGKRYMENLYIGSDFPEMFGGNEFSFSVSPFPGDDADWYIDYNGRFS